MKKGIYALFALVLVVSMGLSAVPAVSAHGGGGGEHGGGHGGGWGDHSGHGTPAPTMPAPTVTPPCPNGQPAVTPEPHHDGSEHCGNCGHPMPTVSPLPAPHPGMGRHGAMGQHEAHARHAASHTTGISGTVPMSIVSAVEEATGMTAEEIAAARAEGQSWSEIITASGASIEDVVAILVEAKAARLQRFVDEGVLSEAFAQQILDMLTLHWTTILGSR